MTVGTIHVRGDVHAPMTKASDVALCGAVGDHEEDDATVTCLTCKAILAKRAVVTS